MAHGPGTIIEKASRRVIEYACGFEKPVLVLEDLSYIREDLDYGEWMTLSAFRGSEPSASNSRT